MKDVRLLAASARSANEFCVSFSGADKDDPYSYIITYVGGATQPWSRRDIPRRVEKVIANTFEDESQSYCALSDEGDVYFLNASGTRHEKIGGAGLYSDDSKGYGATVSMTIAGDSFVVGGRSSQTYHRLSTGKWGQIAPDQLQPPVGFSEITVGSLAGDSLNNLYACATFTPSHESMSVDLSSKIEQAAKAGDLDEIERLYQSIEDANKVDEGRLLHFDGHTWREVLAPPHGPQYPSPSILRDIFMESPDRVWVVGAGGVILLGNLDEGFKDISFRGDQQGLLSITKFRDEVIIASDYGLHRFDGHILSPIKPKLDPDINKNIPTPVKVQAVEDVMYYFDYKHGVRLWDGKSWEEIVIPPELLEREFKGLSSK